MGFFKLVEQYLRERFPADQIDQGFPHVSLTIPPLPKNSGEGFRFQQNGKQGLDSNFLYDKYRSNSAKPSLFDTLLRGDDEEPEFLIYPPPLLRKWKEKPFIELLFLGDGETFSFSEIKGSFHVMAIPLLHET